jgi:dTDP-4-amino-4,6-dideoxygalactose transaminase
VTYWAGEAFRRRELGGKVKINNTIYFYPLQGNFAMTASTNVVPFLNLKQLFHDHRDEFLSAVTRVMENAAFIGGDEVKAFETTFANWVGPGYHVVGCANGTDAITLAAKSLNLPEGSEAIVPAMTYVATAAGLVQAGLKVKLVDVSPGTWLMDPTKLEAAITSKTKLIVPVHLYGQMAPMDEIRRIADKHGCLILEDSAQSHGATWKGKPVGHWGDIATYSFFPGKNLGAFGDAGGILSKNPEYISKCRALGNQGGLVKYVHDYVGYNSRLDNLQAAILNVKMKYISEWTEARRNVAKTYREMLSGVKGLELPVEVADAKHVYHIYAVVVEDRNRLGAFMKEKGIETGIHYPRAIHQLPAFANTEFAKQSFPNAERIAALEFSLPMCPTLNVKTIERVGNAVRAYFG